MQEPTSIHIKTFGCQMNVYDSTRMQGLLETGGFVREDSLADADVILLNTCSIRDKSEHKVLSMLGQLKPLKDKNPSKVIGVTGCVGQRMGRTLLQRVPHLDIVMGPDGVDRIEEIVKSVLQTGKRVLDAKLDGDVKNRHYSQPAVVTEAKPSELLTVMKGCDHFCTYCIVPFVRGREQSRPMAEILEDVRKLTERGTKEVTFLGQNINTYGKGTGESLYGLIEEANRIEKLERIRFVTSHPRDMQDELIAQFGTVEKLCPALHLPVQSGSTSVLKRMSRLYSREEYLEKVAKLRKACPHIALTSDFIVGFPGETEAEFEETLSLAAQVGFAGLYMFKYSPRPGTKAFAYGDEVPEQVKEERLLRLQCLVQPGMEAGYLSRIGKVEKVLVEAVDKKGQFYSGRTPCYKTVHIFNAGEACVGKIIDVEITEANGSNLKGFYVGAPRELKPQHQPRPGRIAAGISASL